MERAYSLNELTVMMTAKELRVPEPLLQDVIDFRTTDEERKAILRPVFVDFEDIDDALWLFFSKLTVEEKEALKVLKCEYPVVIRD